MAARGLTGSPPRTRSGRQEVEDGELAIFVEVGDGVGTLWVVIEPVEPGVPLYDMPAEWNAAEITGAKGSSR